MAETEEEAAARLEAALDRIAARAKELPNTSALAAPTITVPPVPAVLAERLDALIGAVRAGLAAN